MEKSSCESSAFDSDSIDLLLSNCSLNSSEDDQGLGHSLDEEEDYYIVDVKDLVEKIIEKMMKPLDLRKNINSSTIEDDEVIETVSSDDDNQTPLDLSKPSEIKADHPIKSLTTTEKRDLKIAYQKLIRFLRLDPTSDRSTIIKRLQSFLLMYLNEIKKKLPNGSELFNRSFEGEKAIRGFLQLVIGESNKQLNLGRTFSGPNTIRPAKFAVDPDVVQPRSIHQRDIRDRGILSRGAVKSDHQRRQETHPYAHHPTGSKAVIQQQQQHYQGAFTPYINPQVNWSQQPMPHAQLQQALSAPDSFSSEDVALEWVEMVLKKYPNIDEEFPAEELEELEKLFDSIDDPLAGYWNSPPPSNLGSSNPASPGTSLLGSPGSPWQTQTSVGSPYNNPYGLMSPPPSSPSTVCSSPGMPPSPLPRSMVNGMNQMTLQVPNNQPVVVMKSQPPPLIPLNAGSPPVIPPVEIPRSVNRSSNPLLTSLIQPIRFRTAREELMTKLDPVLKEKSLCRVTKEPMETFTRPDPDGDTPLMVASANPNIKLEDLYALIERLKSHPERNRLFTAMNNRRETAIYLAAAEHRPLVSGYLAETMSALRIPMNQSYQKGNSLIHEISSWGDDAVLQYLLRVRTDDNSAPAFDLNATNREGRSALHEAVTLYRPNDATSQNYIKVIQLLLEYGADAGLSDKTSGKTPVHIAIEKRDPALLELLLVKCPRPDKAANAPMYNDNRPLHSAATLSGVTDVQQLELVNILLKYGADKTLRNKANKLPIELVQQDRDRVKGVLQARARQNHYGGN